MAFNAFGSLALLVSDITYEELTPVTRTHACFCRFSMSDITYEELTPVVIRMRSISS